MQDINIYIYIYNIQYCKTILFGLVNSILFQAIRHVETKNLVIVNPLWNKIGDILYPRNDAHFERV